MVLILEPWNNDLLTVDEDSSIMIRTLCISVFDWILNRNRVEHSHRIHQAAMKLQ
jgi:hypothetical protein